MANCKAVGGRIGVLAAAKRGSKRARRSLGKFKRANPAAPIPAAK